MRLHWLMLILTIAITTLFAQNVKANPTLTRLTVGDGLNGQLVRLYFSAPATIKRTFHLENHYRIVIDLAKGDVGDKSALPINNSPLISGIRLGQHDRSLRLVLDLKRAVTYLVEQTGWERSILSVHLRPDTSQMALFDNGATTGHTHQAAPYNSSAANTGYAAQKRAQNVSELRCVPMLHGGDSCKDLLDGVAAGIERRYSGASILPPVELALPGDNRVRYNSRNRGDFGLHRFLRNVQTGKRRKDVGYHYRFDGGEMGLSLLRPSLSYIHGVGENGQLRMRMDHDQVEIGFQNRW